jgi:ribose 5-phosphate isomerase B
MKLIIGSDHGGFSLKEEMKKYISSKHSDIEIEDVGTKNEESCDYPDFAAKVAKKVAESNERGIIICGTGIGVCITANKIKGIRAALCYDEYTTKMAREHNDANILCIGGRTTELDIAKRIVEIFLTEKASEEERHKRRVNKIKQIEKENLC